LAVLHADYATKIVYVRQFKTKGTNTATYDVEMDSVSTSAKIRQAFGAFFKGRKAGSAAPPLPKELTKISINISHTFTTRVRVRIMKQIAICHQAVNPDYNCFVTNFLPRPVLKIKPPAGKVDAYTFVEAVKRFSHHLTPEFLKAEATYAKGVGIDKLLPTFLVLSPDLIQPALALTPAPAPAVKRTADQMEDPPAAGPTKKGKGKGRGKGATKSQKTVTINTRSAVLSTNQFAALASPATPTPATTLETSFTASDQITSNKAVTTNSNQETAQGSDTTEESSMSE